MAYFTSPLNLATGINLFIEGSRVSGELGMSLATMAAREGANVLYLFAAGLPSDKFDCRLSYRRKMLISNATGFDFDLDDEVGGPEEALALAKDVTSRVHMCRVPRLADSEEVDLAALLNYLSDSSLEDYGLIIIDDLFSPSRNKGDCYTSEGTLRNSYLDGMVREIGLPLSQRIANLSLPVAIMQSSLALTKGHDSRLMEPLSFDYRTTSDELFKLAEKIYQVIDVRYSNGPFVKTAPKKMALRVAKDSSASTEVGLVYLTSYCHVSRSVLKDTVRLGHPGWEVWRKQVQSYKPSRRPSTKELERTKQFWQEERDINAKEEAAFFKLYEIVKLSDYVASEKDRGLVPLDFSSKPQGRYFIDNITGSQGFKYLVLDRATGDKAMEMVMVNYRGIPVTLHRGLYEIIGERSYRLVEGGAPDHAHAADRIVRKIAERDLGMSLID